MGETRREWLSRRSAADTAFCERFGIHHSGEQDCTDLKTVDRLGLVELASRVECRNSAAESVFAETALPISPMG